MSALPDNSIVVLYGVGAFWGAESTVVFCKSLRFPKCAASYLQQLKGNLLGLGLCCVDSGEPFTARVYKTNQPIACSSPLDYLTVATAYLIGLDVWASTLRSLGPHLQEVSLTPQKCRGFGISEQMTGEYRCLALVQRWYW